MIPCLKMKTGKVLLVMMLMTVCCTELAAQDAVSEIRKHYAEAQQMVAQQAEWEKQGEMPCPEYYEVNIVQNLPGTGYHRERMRMYYYEHENDDWQPDESMLTRSLHFVTSKYNYAAREFYDEYLYDEQGNIEFAYNRDADMDDFKGGELRLYFKGGVLIKVLVSIRNPKTDKYEQTYAGGTVPKQYAQEHEACLYKIEKYKRLFNEIDRDTFH